MIRVLFRDLEDPTNSGDDFAVATDEADLKLKMRAADFFRSDAYHDDIPFAEWEDPKHETHLNTWADSVTAELLARGISDPTDPSYVWILYREPVA